MAVKEAEYRFYLKRRTKKKKEKRKIVKTEQTRLSTPCFRSWGSQTDSKRRQKINETEHAVVKAERMDG